jgi:D-alanyl-D-alanine carboxypeptidase
MPGYSEHHTGLAVDIVTPSYQVLNAGFAQTDAAVWMAQNAHRYGFIIRYPADKVDVTGIGYEPWHVRYVGIANAKAIFEQGLCLEEYLEKTGPQPS